MINADKNWENVIMSDDEKDVFYENENKRILQQYSSQIQKVLNYEKTELEHDFLGFLHVYKTVDVPEDFTVIDFGCNQAVQALYFEHCRRYIGIDNELPVNARFEQDNAEYYDCTIQQFISDKLPKMIKDGLEIDKTFAICSYVPDNSAYDIIKEKFPYHRIIYGNELISEHRPPLLNCFDCIRLIDKCVKHGILKTNPDDSNQIIVYMANMPEGYPDGWYSQNTLDAASDLCHDGEGQRVLLKALAKKDVIFMSEDIMCAMRKQIYDNDYINIAKMEENNLDKDYINKFEGLKLNDDDLAELIGQLIDTVEDHITDKYSHSEDEIHLDGEEYDKMSQKFKETLTNWHLIQ